MIVKVVCHETLSLQFKKKKKCPCLLAVVVIKVFRWQDLWLVEAPPAGEVLVVFGQLSFQGLHGWSAGRHHDVLWVLLASSGEGQAIEMNKCEQYPGDIMICCWPHLVKDKQ